MNGLSLRISNNGNNNSKKIESKIPLFNLSYLASQRFGSKINNLNDLVEAQNVTKQLEFIRNAAKILDDGHLESSESIIQLFVAIFLEAPLKHPLKNTCARILSNRKDQHQNIEVALSKEILREITSITSLNDFGPVNILSNTINSCFENFAPGVAGVQGSLDHILVFIKAALMAFIEKLRADSIKMSPTEKLELYNFIHNACRVFISILKKCEVAPSDTLNEAFWREFSSLCIFLQNHFELPMDTKGLASIVLVIISRLRFGLDSWIILLQNVYGIQNDSNHLLNTEYNMLDSETAKVYVCSAIVNIVDIEDIATKSIGGVPALIFLCSKLVELSKELSVDTTIILGVARTMLSLSRLLYKVQDVNVAIKAAADLLNFVWSHLEYYVDSVRHLATQILTNIVKLSVTLEKKGNTQLSNEVFSSVMLLPNDRHSKYKGLATLGSEYGCVYLLNKIPNLVEELLSAIDNVIVPANVSYAFDTLMTEYSKESSMEKLFSTWITPILNAVIACKSQDDSSSSPTLTVLEDILTKVVNLNSSLVPLMISAILEQNTLTGNQMSEGQLKCILVCLHVARKMGVFDSKVVSQPPPSSDKWKNVIQYHLLINSMIHHKSEIRLLAFSLVVNPHKTTETFTEKELDLILTFLHYNINVQSPATRQRIIAVSKKLMKRWKDSFDVILRNIGIFQTKIKVLLDADTTGKDKVKPFLMKFTDTIYQLVALRNAYIKFVEKLWTFCLGNIFPGANFSRRSICLQILVLCQEMKSPHISWKWTLENENSLLNYLDDSYECNKELVVELLQHCPLKSFQYNNRESIVHILEDTLKLASSVKPTDCMTSAYKLELLTKFPQELLPVLHNLTEERSNIPYEVQYLMIKVLMKNLANEMDVARDNILMAAAKGPMYGLLFCIKHLLKDVHFGIIASNTEWSSVICQLIQVSFEVNEIVGPIVNNSSPEGHLPMDFNAGTTQDEGTGVQLDCGMKVTAQMVLLCAWRSVKEVSLLLGEISNRAVILENEVGTIDEKTVLEIGEHFTNLLSETKHRGAFEQAYLGFSKLCSRLWKCSSESLHNLPRLWLDDLISAIASGDTKNSKLCSTRRSAGVPYMVQALVTTELQVSGNPQCFQKCMATLLNLARFDKASTSQTDASVEVRTHCLNILRALYRHTALGEHVNSYVADGLMTAIAGFNGATWAERNSSTLLFSSLMTRIFGVQRTKNSDDLGIRNRMTGRIFFQRYPKVYDFIHEEFSDVDEEIENIGKDLLKPSLYPILLLLARLYPSSVEGVDSNLQLAKYIPYLLTCAKSCVLKTRRLAAKAMVPLISHEKYVPHCMDLLKLLSNKEIKTNYCHGILLQLIELLEAVPDNLVFSQYSTELVGLLQNSSWILSNLSGNRPCFVTAESYVRMVFLLKGCTFKIVNKQPAYFLDLEKSLLNPEQVVNTQSIHFGKEGFYIQCLHLKIGLLLSLEKASDVAAVLITALASPMYEIVLTALTYLLCFYESKNLGPTAELELPKSDDCFSNLFQPHETIDILNMLSSSTEYEERLYDLLKKDVYVQCQQKALVVLSFNLGSLTRILALFAPSAKSAKAKLKTLLKLADSESESINYIYLRFISNYMEWMKGKSHSIYLCFTEESIMLLSQVLFECSSSDKSNEKRMECANIFVDHWEFLDWERNQADRVRVQGIILQWSALLKLADDEIDEIKQKMATLANTLIKKQISKYNDTLPYEEFLCNENKAKEIIVEVAAMWMSQESIDHTIITLIIMALGCNTSISEQLIDEECRVFEKGEVNIYQEEIALSTFCIEQINKILNSGQYCTEVWKSCTFKQRTVHILNGIKSRMEQWPSKQPSGDLSAFLIMLENSLKEERDLQVENVFQSKISYHKVTNLVYNLGLIQSPPYLL